MKYVLAILGLVLLTVPAYGKNNGHNNQHQNQNQQEYEHQYGEQSDSRHKNKKAKNHKNKNQRQDLPPGLQKKAGKGKPLPPGWQKKIAKGKRVDDDLYGHLHPVDRETLRFLPPLGYGESYHSIENDIIKLKKSSREILEVIKKNKLLPPPPPPPPFSLKKLLRL